MKMNIFAAIASVALFAGAAHAATLSDSGLTVDIRDDNGAIDTFSFNGVDFFNPGTPVSDFGARVDGSFFTNDTNGGGSPFLVTGSGSEVTAGGFLGTLSVLRTYTIDAVSPVLKITTTLLNVTGASVAVDFFETFDPDQNGFSTTNDVLTTPGGNLVSTAFGSSNATSVLGSTLAPSAIEAGGVFEINSIADLNDALLTPVDGNGTVQDLGQNLIHSFNLGAGESVTFDTFLAAGTSLSDGIANYDAVVAPVPLPASLPLMLAGLGGFAALRRRNKKS